MPSAAASAPRRHGRGGLRPRVLGSAPLITAVEPCMHRLGALQRGACCFGHAKADQTPASKPAVRFSASARSKGRPSTPACSRDPPHPSRNRSAPKPSSDALHGQLKRAIPGNFSAVSPAASTLPANHIALASTSAALLRPISLLLRPMPLCLDPCGFAHRCSTAHLAGGYFHVRALAV